MNIYNKLIKDLDKYIDEDDILFKPIHKPDIINNLSGIYLITDGEYTKIGISSNVHSRLADLQTGNARKLNIIFYETMGKPRAVWCESRLHSALKDYRMEGEWFKLSIEDIKEIINIIYDFSTT